VKPSLFPPTLNLQAVKMQSDFEEQKLLAEQRLTELEKLTENYKGSLEEIEKRKMEVSYRQRCAPNLMHKLTSVSSILSPCMTSVWFLQYV
jgi:DNA repair ATPase RecN